MLNNVELLRKGLEQLNICVNDKMINQFSLFYDLLIEWNSKMNLTAITQEGDVITKHFLDSLLIANFMDLNNVDSIIDVGTGAGFPGIPIKIAFPNIKVTLMDSLNKRINFLETVCTELGLNNIECRHARAEDLSRVVNYRDSYDLVVSRAVSNLSTLTEYCLPFSKINGVFVSYKSVDCVSEVEQATTAIKTLSGRLKEVRNFVIPNSSIERTFVCIEKVKATHKIYPRKSGLPSKNPL